MNILDMDSSAGEQLLPLAPRPVNGAAKEPVPSDRSENDAARIILQLKQKHAEANAAGLGSPELDAFHNLIVSLVAEADDPKAVIAYVAELLEGGSRVFEWFCCRLMVWWQGGICRSTGADLV
ncbi:hypothetical protein ACIPPN_29605, partial [Streptomyces diastaticus]